MSKRHKVVMLNGAIGVGKTWLKNQLKRQRGDSLIGIGFNDGLKEVMSKITGLDLFNDDVYDSFKKTIFENGKSGREWLIMISESSKEFNPVVWVDRFVDRVAAHSRGHLVINDSFGFPDEFLALTASDDIETLNVYIDDGDGHAPAMQIDGDYRQFIGDSRFDLSRHCSIRAANSSSALTLVTQALSNRGW